MLIAWEITGNFLTSKSCNLVKRYCIFVLTDLKGGWTMLSFNFRIRWNAVFKLEIRQLIWLQISNLKWFPHNSMFGSLSCRLPQWGPLFVGIGLTLCNPRLIASSWKCFSCIKLEAVKSPILSVRKCDLLLKILLKVIPVFVYITWYTSNYAAVIGHFIFLYAYQGIFQISTFLAQKRFN